MDIKYNVLKFIKENKIKIISIASIIIIFSVISIIIFNNGKDEIKNKEIGYTEIEKSSSNEESDINYIYVDIKGMIKNPGIYMMNSNDRVNDVINKAGGLIKGANTRYINLSKKVSDEMVIIVYSEAEVAEKLSELTKQDETPCLCESTINDSCINNSLSNISEEQISNELININKATLEELMTLPGIGESKAKAIIDYRSEFGNFNSKEDLMEVTGIGESIYSKIKDLITTG